MTGWAQTNLMVVRHSDNSIWAATCNGLSSCSAWTQIPGGFSVQPTLTWSSELQSYILMGIGNNGSNIWASTFRANGTWDNNWTKMTGASPSPVAVAAGGGPLVARGSVAADGTITRFTPEYAVISVQHTTIGTYDVTVNNVFPTTPDCIANALGGYWWGWVRCAVDNVSGPATFRVVCADMNLNLVNTGVVYIYNPPVLLFDAAFTFICAD